MKKHFEERKKPLQKSLQKSPCSDLPSYCFGDFDHVWIVPICTT
jgi:hypothetical protein